MTSKLPFWCVFFAAIIASGMMLWGIDIFLMEGFEKQGTVLMTLGAVFASVFISQMVGMYNSPRSK